ncbi:MAG: hypothetical protein JXA49_10570 [Actinobacteria bacterium]|nr:hypothetical protein [Actinomycetota bacterium]
MKKYSVPFFILLIAVSSVFVVIERKTVSAGDVLSGSLGAMMNTASFEARGIVCHRTDGEGIRHSEVTTKIRVDLRDRKDIRAQIDMDICGTTTRNYMIGDMMYIDVPQSGWKKAPLSLFEPGSPFLIPDIIDLMKCAENPVMESDETLYVITYDLNPNRTRYSRGGMLAEAESAGKESDVVSDVSQTSEEETVTRATLYVDKETLLVNRAVEEEVHLLPSGGNFEREILTTTEYKYYNYGTPVLINLPEAAESAPSPRQ